MKCRFPSGMWRAGGILPPYSDRRFKHHVAMPTTDGDKYNFYPRFPLFRRLGPLLSRPWHPVYFPKE